jgi:ribosomal protein L11 methyltransferase
LIKAYDSFDYIFANINRNILLCDIEFYVPALKKDGFLYMSGFYREDIVFIEDKCNLNGLMIESLTEHDNWVAVKAKKVQ